jgi:hypothetical protein
MSVKRNPDLVLLALALPVFLVAGLPVLGWVTAAVVWLLWRGIGAYSERRAGATDDPRSVAGITAGSMIGRGWLMGLILLSSGLAFGDEVGLSGGLLTLACFTVYFTLKLATRPAGPSRTSIT